MIVFLSVKLDHYYLGYLMSPDLMPQGFSRSGITEVNRETKRMRRD